MIALRLLERHKKLAKRASVNYITNHLHFYSLNIYNDSKEFKIMIKKKNETKYKFKENCKVNKNKMAYER